MSLPGCMNLSPGCKLEIDKTIAVSRNLMPVMEIFPMVYSRGILAFSQSSNLGSTEVGLVVSSCACTEITDVTTIISKAHSRSKIRCMVVCSSLSFPPVGAETAAMSLMSLLPPYQVEPAN